MLVVLVTLRVWLGLHQSEEVLALRMRARLEHCWRHRRRLLVLRRTEFTLLPVASVLLLPTLPGR